MGIALTYFSEADRKTIARDLFKLTSTDEEKGELHGLCPIHQETRPSFSYNFRKDQYHCFSCGADGDFVRLWSEVHGYGRKEGFKAFCETFHVDPGKPSQRRAAAERGSGGGPQDPTADLEWAWEKFPPLPADWVARLEKTRGWSQRWIEILDLRLQTFYRDKSGGLRPVKDPDRVAIPVRQIDGRLVNIRLWRPTGEPPKIISWAKQTGASRLFPARVQDKGAKDSDNELSETILLCEGESDTICALSHGFNAITQTTKLSRWPDDHLAVFKNRNVVIAYDADLPGVKYSDIAARNLAGIARSVKILTWPDFMGRQLDGTWPAKHGEDLTDFFVKHGKITEDLIDLVKAAHPFDPSQVSAPPSSSSLPSSSSPSSSPPSPPPPPSPPSSAASPSATPTAVSAGIQQFFEYGLNKRYSFKPRLLAEKILKDLTLMSDPGTGLLYQWNGRFWEILDEGHIKAMAIRYLENEAQKSRVEDAVYQVWNLATIPCGRMVNDRLDWISLQNGMLNFMTFEMAPHDPDFYCTYALPVSFNPDSEERCDLWERFLEMNIQTPEAIAQAQEFAGYCLVRHTRFEKCLFLLGPGRDGKSTFMKVLKELVGDVNCAAVSFPDLENEFHRSSLYNKLLNISTEIGGQAIESPYFKAITSGDPINAAFKHRDAFTFSPYCKLIFAGNMLPRVKDNSDAYFQRVLPIQFKRQYLEGDPTRDTELLGKLKNELSEIFYWALCGLKRLTAQKRFTDCEETRTLLMGYRRSNNPILCYVEDECILGADKEVARADIYSSYRKYCSGNGYLPVNRENFFRELYAAVNNLNIYRPRWAKNRDRVLQGIALREGEQP